MVNPTLTSPALPSTVQSWREKFDPPKGLGLVLGGIAAWLILAMIAFVLLPSGSESERSMLEVMSVYFKHAARNGVPAIIVAGSFAYALVIMGKARVDRTMLARKMLVRQFLLSVLGLICFGLMIFAYSMLKVRITAILPFVWDEPFARWDAALLFGRQGWEWLARVYDYPKAIYVIEMIYSMWAGLLAGGFVFAFTLSAFNGPKYLRFPLALMLVWFVGGNILALFFSSAGPCYYALLALGADPYAGQMALLHALPSGTVDTTLEYQAMLWNVFESDSYGLGGISAMPSMHCATSFLFVCVAWNIKWLRYLALAFALFIWVSSVILAWHYAVDGLFAIPIAIGAWWFAGKLMPAHDG